MDTLDRMPEPTVPNGRASLGVHVAGEAVTLPALYALHQKRSWASRADAVHVIMVAQVVLQDVRRFHVPG
eukprot:9485142-Pyramimonas_sp.AAC.1